MKKKILGIFVCMLLVVTIFPTMVLADGNEFKVVNNIVNEKKETSNYNNNDVKGMFNKKTDNTQDIITVYNVGQGEVLDQYMDHTNNWGWWVAPFQWIAQGFKPTLDTLTRVELYYFRAGNPSDSIQIIVSIRDDLYGSDIVSYSVNAGQITHPGTWINVDLPDITVIPEQSYYIVCRATGGDPDNIYCWYIDFNNPYTRGDAWGSIDEGYFWWLLDNPPEQPQTDCCFKTYGFNEPPNKPTITGPKSGKPGVEYNFTFSATDPDGHNLYYYINWGDSSVEEWIGPYPSGEDVIIGHSWERIGLKIIRAKVKDIVNAESGWTTYSVIMPITFRGITQVNKFMSQIKYIGILIQNFICGSFKTNI